MDVTFNPNADVSDNRARSGRRTAAIAGGGVVGVGGIIALVVALLSGGNIDLSGILGAGGDQQSSQRPATDPAQAECLTGADANADDTCRLKAATLSLDKFWAGAADGYHAPTLEVISGATQTPCGTASNAVGPFYCPPNETIYIDPTFFQVMREQFNASAGNLAQLYVLGHEWGHHVQKITGVMEQHPADGTGEDSNGVKTELQADCYAGGWVRDMTKQKDAQGQPYFIAPTKAQIADALNAAAAVGDDNIQRGAGVRVNPESWTHGSSADRMTSFTKGLNGGVGVCAFGTTLQK